MVARDQFPLDLLDAPRRLGQGERYLADRTLQPRQMRSVVDQLAVQHGSDLVDAVGERKPRSKIETLASAAARTTVDVSDLIQRVLLKAKAAGRLLYANS